MTSYTRANLEGIVSQLDIEAKQAGLLPMDHKLVYNLGNVTNGISATVMVKGPNGGYAHGYDRFIPEFTYKTTRKEQYKLIGAALNVLYALRIQREAVEKAEQSRKMDYLSEHVSRRSR